jgi:hypothetical protein
MGGIERKPQFSAMLRAIQGKIRGMSNSLAEARIV